MRIVVVLPEPLGPRKPTISPAATRKRDVVDGDDAVERLGEAGDVDDVHGRLCGRSTSTIWPGCSRSATSWAGRASTR